MEFHWRCVTGVFFQVTAIILTKQECLDFSSTVLKAPQVPHLYKNQQKPANFGQATMKIFRESSQTIRYTSKDLQAFIGSYEKFEERKVTEKNKREHEEKTRREDTKRRRDEGRDALFLIFINLVFNKY